MITELEAGAISVDAAEVFDHLRSVMRKRMLEVEYPGKLLDPFWEMNGVKFCFELTHEGVSYQNAHIAFLTTGSTIGEGFTNEFMLILGFGEWDINIGIPNHVMATIIINGSTPVIEIGKKVYHGSIKGFDLFELIDLLG